jgi:hypothetical protein
LANGGSDLSPVGDIFHQFHNSRIASLSQGKRKKGGRNMGESAPCQNKKIGGKMKRKKTKRKQQGCDVAKVIDTVEQAVSTARKVYRAIEPVVNAITNRRKGK